MEIDTVYKPWEDFLKDKSHIAYFAYCDDRPTEDQCKHFNNEVSEVKQRMIWEYLKRQCKDCGITWEDWGY